MAWLGDRNDAFGTSLRFVLVQRAGLSDLRGSGVVNEEYGDQLVMVAMVMAGSGLRSCSPPLAVLLPLCTSSDAIYAEFISR